MSQKPIQARKILRGIHSFEIILPATLITRIRGEGWKPLRIWDTTKRHIILAMEGPVEATVTNIETTW